MRWNEIHDDDEVEEDEGWEINQGRWMNQERLRDDDDEECAWRTDFSPIQIFIIFF